MSNLIPKRSVLTRRGFAALTGSALLAACTGDLLAPGVARRPLFDMTSAGATDRLTGTAQLIEKPAGSGKWRLVRE